MTFLEDLARRVALAEDDRLMPSDVGIRVPCSHVRRRCMVVLFGTEVTGLEGGFRFCFFWVHVSAGSCSESLESVALYRLLLQKWWCGGGRRHGVGAKNNGRSRARNSGRSR